MKNRRIYYLIDISNKIRLIRYNHFTSQAPEAMLQPDVDRLSCAKIIIIDSSSASNYQVFPCQQRFVSVVTAGNQEVKTGTNDVVISCKVSGLTVQLGSVIWQSSTGTPLDGSGYTKNDGSLQGDNTQTTTLTVASAQVNSDSTYSCLVTPGSQDDPTEVSQSVVLNIYSK